MTLPSSFLKTHSMGNDFVVLVDLENAYAPTPKEVQLVCNRHFGIGADGLIRIGLILASDLMPYEGLGDSQYNGDFEVDNISYYFMDYYNADGTIAKMCGNGIKCVAKVLEQSGIHDFGEQEVLEVATRAGLKRIHKLADGFLSVDMLSVDMGAARMNLADDFTVDDLSSGMQYTGAKYVNVGNDHIVVEVSKEVLEKTKKLHLEVGQSENTGVSVSANIDANIELVNVDASAGKIQMRVQERGVGETLSCGTGICAVATYASQVYDLYEWEVTVPGGVAKVVVDPETRTNELKGAEFVVTVTLIGDASYVGKFSLADEYADECFAKSLKEGNAH